MNENKHFVCPEESSFFSNSLETIFFPQIGNLNIDEFGSGDGMAVIKAIIKSGYKGIVFGYETNINDYSRGISNIVNYAVNDRYRIKNKSYFDIKKSEKNNILISNPPYVPSVKPFKKFPYVYGGCTGDEVTNHLLSLGYKMVFLLISGISNPLQSLKVAEKSGYIVNDFCMMMMPFGLYTSELSVQKNIFRMRQENKAFFVNGHYPISAVLFSSKKTSRDNTYKLREEFIGLNNKQPEYDSGLIN